MPQHNGRDDVIMIRHFEFRFRSGQVKPGARETNPAASQPFIASSQHQVFARETAIFGRLSA